ncbi:hypothetical protein B0H14DRAFT_3540815 [Mycena olivaceomarginata]|nr:hypothetical protein B0H14DRAFT_3540815 [Mycena olivaceomarginata]
MSTPLRSVLNDLNMVGVFDAKSHYPRGPGIVLRHIWCGLALVMLPLFGLSIIQVALIWSLGALNAVLVCHSVYHYLVLSYTNPLLLIQGEWSVYVRRLLHNLKIMSMMSAQASTAVSSRAARHTSSTRKAPQNDAGTATSKVLTLTVLRHYDPTEPHHPLDDSCGIRTSCASPRPKSPVPPAAL